MTVAHPVGAIPVDVVRPVRGARDGVAAALDRLSCAGPVRPSAAERCLGRRPRRVRGRRTGHVPLPRDERPDPPRPGRPAPGAPSSVPRRLERALVAADRAHRVTDGRFDPRVLRRPRAARLRGAPAGDRRCPGSSSGAAAIVARVGPGRVAVDEPIDLGGHRQGPRPSLGRGDRRTPRRATGTCSRPAATSSSVVRARTAVHGRSGSRTRPVSRSRWPRSRPPRAGPWRRPRSGCGRGSRTDGPCTICSTRGPVSRRRAVCAPSPSPRPDPAWAEVWSKTLFIGGHARDRAPRRARRGFAAWWVDRRRASRDDAGGTRADRLGDRRGLRPRGQPAIRTGRAPPPARPRSACPSRAPGARDRQAGRDDRTTRGLRQSRPAARPAASAPLSVSPAPDRVDGLDVRGVDGRRPAADDEQRAVGAEADEGRRFPPGPSRRLGLRGGLARHRPARRAPLRWASGCRRGRASVAPSRRRRGRVEDRRRARDPAEAERLVRGPGPDLVADQDDVTRDRRQPLEARRGPRPRSSPRWRRSATAIAFSPARSTSDQRDPGRRRPAASTSPARSMPSASSAARASAPNASSPTAPMNATVAPSRAAATAWFAPLPPWCRS